MNEDNDIEYLRSVVQEQLNQMLQNEETQIDNAIVDADNQDRTSYVVQMEQDNMQYKISKFYSDFSKRLHIYDPLDRDIKKSRDEPENQAIKTQDLKEILNSMPQIYTLKQKLTIPNNVKTYQDLKEMFRRKELEIREIATRFLEDARRDYPKIQEKFVDNEHVVKLKKIYKFFSQNNLLRDAYNMMKRYNSWVNEQNDRINEKRDESVANIKMRGDKEWEEAQALFAGNMDQLDFYNAQLQYDGIVEYILKLMDEFEKYYRQEKKFLVPNDKIDKMVKEKYEQLMNVVRERCKIDDIDEFLKFVYEIRKQDYGNRFTEKLIKDHVHIPVLYEIIMAQSWNQSKDLMEFNENSLEVSIIKEKNEVLCYQLDNDYNQNKLNVKNEKSLNKKTESHLFKISLTRGCFLISTIDKRRRMAAVRPPDRQKPPDISESQDQKVSEGKPFGIELIDRDKILHLMAINQIENTQWVLSPARDECDNIIVLKKSETEAPFNIQLNYGEIQPRAIMTKSWKKGVTLKASMDEDGYNDKWSRWIIRIKKKKDQNNE